MDNLRTLTLKEMCQAFPQLPQAKAEVYHPLLVEAMKEYGINNVMRIAAFLAQIGHESLDLYYMQEIASGAKYEGRLDLGNTEKGDGIRFKGRGPIQITGRSNYQQITEAFKVDFINEPQLAAQPEFAFKISCWWWDNRKLNEQADKPDFERITKVINGGTNGQKDRNERYVRCKEIFKING